MIAMSRRIVSGVSRGTQDVAGERDYALRLPGQQHLSIFGDLVLPFLGPREVVWIDILKTDEYARDTCASCRAAGDGCPASAGYMSATKSTSTVSVDAE